MLKNKQKNNKKNNLMSRRLKSNKWLQPHSVSMFYYLI